MPVCRKCENQFSRNILIDGKYRNLQNRKTCLSCKPFGIRESIKQLELIYVKITCSSCSRIYDYHHAATKGHTKTRCNSCLVNDRRFSLKQKCVKYKGGCCQRCQYSKSIRALCFHHLDPTQKEFQISGKHCYRWEKIKIELDKCILLCNNCHAEVHDEIESQKSS